MVKINIEGFESIDDTFYRYKMPKIEVIYEKNKTVITNLYQIANDLGRDVVMLMTFYKKYYGTNLIFKNSKYTLNKKIDSKELQNSLKEFIEYGVI
jgi:translation initiation factor 2 beta subunit (eIF-2beta)/eIF-5